MYSKTFVFSKTEEKVNTDSQVEEICFREEVPRTGNYEISVELTASGMVLIFTDTGLLVYKRELEGKETICGSFSLNVCDVIPEGMRCLMEKRSVDIRIYGEELEVHRITVKQGRTATLYAVSDAGVTWARSQTPLLKDKKCLEWGSMLPVFVEKGIAVANHVNAGMTMSDFQTEGYYALIQAHLRIGDYLMLQFSRTEQREPDEESNIAYCKSLLCYIDETRARGAHPILVTPSERGAEGVALECVKADAQICRELGSQYHVPVIDIQKHHENTSFGLAALIVREYRKLFRGARADAYFRLAGILREREDALTWHEVS